MIFFFFIFTITIYIVNIIFFVSFGKKAIVKYLKGIPIRIITLGYFDPARHFILLKIYEKNI